MYVSFYFDVLKPTVFFLFSYFMLERGKGQSITNA